MNLVGKIAAAALLVITVPLLAATVIVTLATVTGQARPRK